MVDEDSPSTWPPWGRGWHSTDLSVSGRLRVVPHFSSGIVEQAKRERAWKSPHARKGDTRRGESVSPFLAWGDVHSRSCFACSTIPEEKWGTTRSLVSGEEGYSTILLAQFIFWLFNNAAWLRRKIAQKCMEILLLLYNLHILPSGQKKFLFFWATFVTQKQRFIVFWATFDQLF